MKKRRPTLSERKKVEAAAGILRCEYCHLSKAYHPETLHLDHIIPPQFGGSSEWSNLAIACSPCNSNKHDKTSAIDSFSGLLEPIFHPRNENWEDHFEWDEDFLTLLGRTPTGRATIELLKMNSPERQNLRRAMRAVDDHP